MSKEVEFADAVCIVCGKQYELVGARALTCSEECHKKLVKILVQKFGEYKKVCSAVTGKCYKVPTMTILEYGITKLKAVLFFVKCPVCLSVLRKTEDSDLFYCEGCDVVIDPIHILRSDRAGKPVCPTCFGSLTPIYVAEKIIGDIY